MGISITISVGKKTGDNRHPRDRRWLRRGVVVVALTLGAAMLVGVSDAQSPSTRVNFTALDPPRKILNNATIAPKTNRVVQVAGGTTTVPSDATTVRLTVVAHGAKAGAVQVFTNGALVFMGPSVTWSAGGVGQQTIAADVGQDDSVVFRVTSTASAVVTATITGYSTEVETNDISTQGGSTGDVLTVDGNHAYWEPVPGPSAYYDAVYNPITLTLEQGSRSVIDVVVAPGTYLVQATGWAFDGGESEPGKYVCLLSSDENHNIGYNHGTVFAPLGNRDSTVAALGIVQVPQEEDLQLRCQVEAGVVRFTELRLAAIPMGHVEGDLTPPGGNG